MFFCRIFHKYFCVIVLCLNLLFIVGCTSKPQEQEASVDYGLHKPGGDFALTDHDGKPFHLSDLKGKVVFLFFGYLSCPDICPMTISKLSKVYTKLDKEKQKQVVTLFVSIDPKRDTPERIKEYLSYFKINAIGLTGTRQEIDKVVKQYGAMYETMTTDSALGYFYNHTDTVYVIDPNGDFKFLIHQEDTPEQVIAQLRNW